ncbi:MAG TPA: glycerophosphodiester phosphodiesterase family protein [Steroidobacter sp.]|nr:glycerophosphodiester phosphodiesterase family protein [Steroidobacter sp.]
MFAKVAALATRLLAIKGSGMTAEGDWNTLDGAAPLVIAHRGASGYRPEHTLASYALAIELGADYIEPDLVATKDGRLIARHEPLLDDTTDVKAHADFANRRSTKLIDGKCVEGFFASDFTLEEIKRLRAVQANPARSREYDGRYEIPTFAEILELRLAQSRKHGRRIGIYPETKHPSFHAALGLPLEERLLGLLRDYGLDRADAPVFIQSFESGNLQDLRTQTAVPLVQLLEDGSLIYDESGARVARVNIPQHGDWRGRRAPQTFADIAQYANAIGPWKRQILRDIGGGSLLRTSVVEQAHAVGLYVHTYTFRSESASLAPEYRGEPSAEYRAFFELGVDGVFSDFADAALAARAAFSTGAEARKSSTDAASREQPD